MMAAMYVTYKVNPALAIGVLRRVFGMLKLPDRDVAASRQRRFYRTTMATRRRLFRRGRPQLLVVRANGDEATKALLMAQIAMVVDEVRRNPWVVLASAAFLASILAASAYVLWAEVDSKTSHDLFGELSPFSTILYCFSFAVLLLGLFGMWFPIDRLFLWPFGVQAVRFRKGVSVRANSAPTGVPARFFIVPDEDVAGGMRHAVYNSPAAQQEVAEWIVSIKVGGPDCTNPVFDGRALHTGASEAAGS
ncbi:hypothetical protein [Paludisphaera soli]|uniref:hypothetical protein n=1 Tax=Paludisphaera soli TaxID=2712865 RepID=UPI0013EDDA7E|nr:hypothetical protein [Paludisphaera soli]